VLPGKLLKEGRRTRVHRNWVVRNNLPNFGDPEAIVGSLPHGIGILLMGADDTVVENNQVRENASLGIAVTRLAELHAKKDPPLDPLTDGARILANHLDANGAAPHPAIEKSYGAGGDFGWDGTGRGNCADLADGARPVGAPIPGCLEASAPAPALSHAGHEAPSPALPLPPPDLSGAAAVVHIRGMRFEPRHVSVKAGETVVWVNDDNLVHTVTSGAGTLPSHTPLASPFLTRGQSFRHTFGEAGKYEYLCLPHLDQATMRGATVTVTE
jgi:plastocyanin